MIENKVVLGMADEKFIATRELKVGCLYYSGKTPWRSIYCYLGRTVNNGFLWLFIGNEKRFVANPCSYITDRFYGASDSIHETKTNKRVRVLTAKSVEHMPFDACLVGVCADFRPIQGYLAQNYGLQIE